ncbi:hypothetical protein UCREL1_63 [Eutypa lata UCREL1]|uniref:Uncharacterized protein n=1 Tax=Eutypa lata (strain UCR-EL1) TaxID=1287681 RepID=M7U1R2_EUTLA|nr:hypothetical protein UCREL1_63 [Eutypa lata UCREL1]
MGSTAAYSGYYQEPATAFSAAMSQNTMPYQSEYGQDSRQTQSFSTYNPSMMYNVPQAGTPSTVYDTSQQFPSRQAAGLQMMPADVAAPYFPSEPTNAAAAASSLQQQGGSSSASSVYQQSPADQRAMLQTYPSGMPSMGGMAQTSAPDQVMEEQDYSASAEMGEAYEQYQSTLKEIFTNVKIGALQPASESLVNVSDWLLTKVADLGLTGDDEALHNDRIKLWHDFNHSWLALFQKQKDMMDSGVLPQRGQTLITEEGLKKMGKDLVRLCDGIERHGLVDYEYGVWEESIVEILGECLDQYDKANNQPGSSGANAAGPSHHT